MKTIALKFIQQYISQGNTALILLSFSLMHALILFVLPNDYNILQGEFADLELYFESIPYILMLLIPAVGMGSFAQEQQWGTLEILLTKPLNRSELVWGKFLGVLGVVLIWLIPLGLYAIAVSELSDERSGFDWGQLLAASLGILLLCWVWSAVVVWASLSTSKQMLALLVSIGINGFFWWGWEQLSYIIPYNGTSDMVLNWSLNYQFQQWSKGVIHLHGLFYGGFVALLFLWSCRVKLNQNSDR